ncbi:RNA polymerase sigma factor [Streptomyces syringium]|uniref:RNA polymerase sigma factor n=1 Tax=Streptomyces syringium TaxID=76729 RepID=UPI00344509F1
MAARLVPEPEGEQPRLVGPFIPAQVPPALGEETRSLLSDEALRSIYSRVWRYLRSRGVSVADAEEVTQESVFAAWRRRPPLESASATAYALTTARNKYVDLVRVRHRRPELLTDFTDWDRPSDEDVELLAENSAQAREAMKILKEVVPVKRDRDAFLMCEIWRLTGEEAADLLGAPSAGAIRTAVSKARTRLRAHRQE